MHRATETRLWDRCKVSHKVTYRKRSLNSRPAADFRGTRQPMDEPAGAQRAAARRAGGEFRTQSTPVLPNPPEPLSVGETLDASSRRGAT